MFNLIPAEEPENESQTSSTDKWNECESMQKLASYEDNFNSCSDVTDHEGNRYRYILHLHHSVQIIS